jgi:hypothetical protein
MRDNIDLLQKMNVKIYLLVVKASSDQLLLLSVKISQNANSMNTAL